MLSDSAFGVVSIMRSEILYCAETTVFPDEAVGHSSTADPAPASYRVLDKLRQGLCVFDGRHRLALFNRRYAEMYGLDPDALRPGMTLREIVDLRSAAGTGPDTLPAEYAGWRKQIALDNRVTQTIVHLRNGRVIEIHHEPTPDGGWVSTHDDITERKHTEAQVAASEARMRALTDALPQMVWVARGSDGATIWTNQRFQSSFGAGERTREERIGAHHPDDRARAGREWAAAERDGRIFETEARWRIDAGPYRWHKLVIAPVRREGEIVEWLGTALDIEEIVAAREALRVSEERLALAFDAGSDGLWDCDLATGEVWSSDRWWRTLGYEPRELSAHASTWRALIHPEDREQTLHLLRENLRGHTSLYECEHRLRRKDGSWGWVLARGKVVARAADGRALRFVGTHIDIGARKAAEGQIAHMARHDTLTDLPNRALFHERLEGCLAKVRRQGITGAVLCLDLDRFKVVNDTLGHLAGDALLREVAHRLRTALRAEDTVARLGGDEFAVLLAGPDSAERARALAEHLIAAVREPVTIGDQQVDVGLSVGIALVPEHGMDADAVLKRADLALYRAKADGRNNFRVFEAAMDEAVSERRKLELDLRRALVREELTLHYQPQVRSETGEIVGFEALVRWTHPTRGLVPPSTFVPLAEENGLIAPLGEWVLRAACREAASWTVPLKVAVNLSPRQFQQFDLPEIVLSILAETGLSPDRLELEVTETVIINDMTRALAILRRLKDLGIRISMDDFGTGYSSLATLQAFPFDKLKIDRSFVGSMGQSVQAAVIVRAVLGLGRSLGMGVIAEGVETAEQMQFLLEEACDEVQGYLTGRPQPISAFAATVQGRGTEHHAASTRAAG